jgi:predicted nucleic acid-binding protein
LGLDSNEGSIVILDTNAFSALAEGDPELEPVLRKAQNVFVPVIVLGEYRYGISQSRKRAEYERWIEEHLLKFRVLDVDEQTTVPYSAIRAELKKAGTPIPSNDSWIAALSRQHSLAIVSRDTHFDLVPGIKRISW